MTLEDLIYEESRKRFPYHQTHIIEDDIKADAFETGALWMSEYLFKRVKEELQNLTYQEYSGAPFERLIFDDEIETIFTKIQQNK